ncbi:MAG: outer membrane lipoprotein chaperone LolA [Gammaproteobacteria bacterium]
MTLPYYTGNLLAAFLFVYVAHAQAAPTALERYLDGLETLRASFDQELIDERGSLREQARGTLYLHRPGRFRWDYHRPYQQTIVADGIKVWIYDKELEQVTVKPLAAALGSTPALLLGGKVDIHRELTVTALAKHEGLDWMRLVPKDREAQFTDVRLGFAGKDLRRMDLKDNFGQTTRIRFYGTQRNLKLDPKLFVFTPPRGVDVLDTADDP